MGVALETFVPTCFDKSAWAIVAMLSVLRAGAAAVPLDATHPKSALELRVQDTNAKIVLASPSRAHLFANMGVHVISVGKEFLDQLPSENGPFRSVVGPSNPAFVIYTSGSTGKPKGVVLENRAICSSGFATGTAYGWGPGSRVLQFASYVGFSLTFIKNANTFRHLIIPLPKFSSLLCEEDVSASLPTTIV
jgi:non-ribosomal peptide synthetase component F